MKLPFDKKYLGLGITMFSVIAASILFYLTLNNFSVINKFFSAIWKILTPVVMGLAIAYILNPIMCFLENKCFTPLFAKAKRLKQPKKLVRALSLLVTLAFACGIITALIWLVIPQLLQSIIDMCNKFPENVQTIQKFLDSIFAENPEILQYANAAIAYIDPMIKDMIPGITTFAGNMAMGAVGFLSVVANLLIGIVISIYLLYSKETFSSQIKRVCYAVFSKNFNRKLFSTIKTTDHTFGGFISGKLLDSTIIGILCFIFCSIVNMPYALLVSVLIGVTNIIPFFGPFFGAVPSAFIILLESPMMALLFIIFVIILQQIDGNIIGPKILGDSTGLSAFWVIFAILFGGGLFGVAGMFIGVPTFAVIYIFIASATKKRLTTKNLPTDPESYSGTTDEIETKVKIFRNDR